jgi:hypothetical protein
MPEIKRCQSPKWLILAVFGHNFHEVQLRRAENFIWKRMEAMTRLLDVAYEKGIKVCGNDKADLEKRLQRSSSLPWWDITILPKTVSL